MDFSEAGRKERALEIFKALVQEYPEARPHLNYSSPYQLLVATILAAQCTDEAVKPSVCRQPPLPLSREKLLTDPSPIR